MSDYYCPACFGSHAEGPQHCPAARPLAPLTGSENAAEEAVREVVKATTKFPTWPTDPLHALAVVQEEVGELTKEVVQLTYEPHKSSPEAVRREAVQTAAMALRFLMSLDRYVFAAGQQHSQNDEVSDGGPLTHESPAEQHRRSLH